VESRPRPFDEGGRVAKNPPVTLHLIKLCVGCDSVDDLIEWIDWRLADLKRQRKKPQHAHVTRMVPKRIAELLDGGSLYWVIKGSVQARQRLLAIEPFTDEEGIGRCRLVLEPKVVATDWQPKRAFQGWRYYEAKDAPVDLTEAAANDLPPSLRAELAELGLR
jgi:hypothetical protein